MTAFMRIGPLAICLAFIAVSATEAHARRMTELVSPRLLQLKAEVEAGDADAVAAFWKRIETEGTPLVEPLDGIDDYVWLTFLYRGDPSITSVVVIGGISGRGPHRPSTRTVR